MHVNGVLAQRYVKSRFVRLVKPQSVCEIGTVGKISDYQPEGSGFSPGLVEGWTLGNPLLPHHPWTGTLKPLV